MAKKKIHALVGRPKSRRHRERLAAAGRAWHSRIKAALAAAEQANGQ